MAKRFGTMAMALALAVASGGCAMNVAGGTSVRTDYAAALADPTRPEADRARDALRKPAELLAFAQIKRGDRVGDWFMGGGYLTRVLAAVVGPTGHVYAFQPDEMLARRATAAADQRAITGAYANVDAINGPTIAPAFPTGLDAVITVQNFHDTYHKPNPEDTAARAMRAIFAALKPGGTLTVVDHSAAPGSGTRDADTLHRIDVAVARQVITGAGFRLEAESPLFANPADPRDKSVFDPSIRGHTDQFALRFRKPR